ncbi:hypothetical protein [Streptomyces sp. NPDC088019]|uniref:hypothetical protein n=1 Tax=Streptomyces sp. NPDC088019 TaxID=3365821 RepID=UPI0037FF29A2
MFAADGMSTPPAEFPAACGQRHRAADAAPHAAGPDHERGHSSGITPGFAYSACTSR